LATQIVNESGHVRLEPGSSDVIALRQRVHDTVDGSVLDQGTPERTGHRVQFDRCVVPGVGDDHGIIDLGEEDAGGRVQGPDRLRLVLHLQAAGRRALPGR
jgi:hypothetical protein